MGEVTIEVPGEHVAQTSYMLETLLTDAGETIAHFGGFGDMEMEERYARVREAIEQVRAISDLLDQVAWGMEHRAQTLKGDADILGRAFDMGVSYTTETLRGDSPDLNGELDQARWFSETRDSIESAVAV